MAVARQDSASDVYKLTIGAFGCGHDSVGYQPLSAGHFDQSSGSRTPEATARGAKLTWMTPSAAVDPLRFRMSWPVRGYELDSRGHVNNAVYLSWVEEIATAHAEAAGYGQAWSEEKGGGWVIRRSEITYHSPAVYGDVVLIEVVVELVRGARGLRRTTMRRAGDGVLFAEALTEWVWVRLSDGRAVAAPRELVAQAAEVTRQTLNKRRIR